MSRARLFGSGPRVPRRAGFLVVVAAVLALGFAGCEGMIPDERDKEEDDEARKSYYETAAQTYYDGGKYEASAGQWRKVIALEPDNPKANWGLAKSLAKIGRPGELRAADTIYERIVGWDWTHPTRGDLKFEVEKDHAEVHMELAEFYDKNVRALNDMLKDPREDKALRGRQLDEQTRLRDERLRKAIPLYERVLVQSKDNPYALAGLARAHLLAGDDARGIDYARQYVEISRKSQEGWKRKLKDYETEVQGDVSREQRELFRDKIRGAQEKELKMHLLLASVLMRNRMPEAAVREYDRVLEIDPARPAAYVERAQALADAGDYAKAIRDLEEYLKITDPVKQREARVSAAGLLEQYRKDSAARRAPGGASAAPPAAPAVAPR